MTTFEPLTPAHRLLEQAQEYARGELVPENPKFGKLLKRIAKDPKGWLGACERMGEINWATEVFLLGLTKDEQESVMELLEASGVRGIKLNSSEGYKALAISGVKSHLEAIHGDLLYARHELEDELPGLIRFDPNGVVISGYKRGRPYTSYLGTHDLYHQVYLDSLGEFETIKRAAESKLRKGDDFLAVIQRVERLAPQIRETWALWKYETKLLSRIENLEKFSDAGGGVF